MIDRHELLFSVIMPAYNTPIESIENAIKSIVNQSESSIEIIIVDDGSNEQCAKAIDVLKNKDERIVAIHQKNGGVSNARNKGISIAKGKYILFVDADDEMGANCLEQARDYIKQYEPDVIYASIEYIPEIKQKQNNGTVDVFEGRIELQEVNKCILDIFPRKLDYKILGTPCARVYKADIVKRICFEEGVPLCEDQLFNRKFLKEANKVIVVPDIWYYYIQNDFSAMHSTMSKSYYKMAKPYWDELLKYNRNEEIYIRGKLCIQSLGLYYTVLKKDFFGKSMKFNDKMHAIKISAAHPLFQDAIEFLNHNKVDMNKSQKIGFFLLKKKMYLLIYVAQRIKTGKMKNE